MKNNCLLLIIPFLLFFQCSIEEGKDKYIPPIDYEGYEYDIVHIGTQIWMAENLKTSKYRNGDDIETTSDLYVDLTGFANLKYQWSYAGNENYISDYGRLYTWYSIMDPRGVCPEGWKIPNNEDWIILTNYLGGEDIAGDALKEIGITHWYPPNTNASNETGFTAIPAGYRKANGEFRAIGYHARWWSSSESSFMNAYRFGVRNDRSSTSLNADYSKVVGYSVRCLKK